jgi:tight adherence protein C
LPDALDLLRACVAAGLPLRRSLALVSEHSAEPIAGEFAAVAAEAALGVPHSQALEAMARRNPQPEMRSLVTALTGAERDGTPLAPVIAAQAKDARQAHNREILERGARAGPKIQLIVSTMIVPGALGALAAVMIAAIAHGRIHLV